jgi:multidrug efflux pump subunit AcrA (membrane-fusion protein)
MDPEPQGPPPEKGTEGPPPDTGTEVTPPETGSDLTQVQVELDKARAEARRWESRAKGNSEAAKELDRLRRESMNDQERAAAEAADKATSEVTARLGGRLVRAEMRAAAGGRLSAEQVEALASHLDVTAFLTTEGDVNEVAIAQFVDSIAPPAPAIGDLGPVFPDLGQGARGTPTPLNGDPLLHDLQAKLGLR